MDARRIPESPRASQGDDSATNGLRNIRPRVVVLSSHTPSLFWFRMDMMKSFQDKGYDVFALGNEAEELWKDKFIEAGITYKQINVERNGTNPIHDLAALVSIYKRLKEIKPLKVFAYQVKPVVYGGIAARRLGIKQVYPLIAGVGSMFLKDDLKTRLIRRLMIAEYKLGMKHSPVVFFQNRDDEKIFRDCGIIDKQKVAMIPGSGVNCNKFAPSPMPETFGFLCVSRLIRDKGVYEYLEACKIVKERYPEVRCLLVGPYDANPSALKPEELEPFIKNGVVEYFGEQEDVRPYLAQCNVFVLPSYREGTPKANLEAMACGRAVITTDAPGCRETTDNGANGYLVPVKNVQVLAEKMEELYKSPDLVAKMGKNGRKKAETRFDVNIVNRIICESMGIA